MQTLGTGTGWPQRGTQVWSPSLVLGAMCYLEEGRDRGCLESGYHYKKLLPSFHCQDTVKGPREKGRALQKRPASTQGTSRGSIPPAASAGGRVGSRLLSWRSGSTAAPHGDAANALELMTPGKAEASPSSVVSATTHPQAMDQRGCEKIRRIHFNFKT